MDELLRMRGVRKGYGGAYIFQNLDLTVSKGRIVGLIGDNGTGKTTLLRLLAGLIPPDDGEVIRQESILGKSGISYLADSSWFYGWMKVRDAVSFYSNFYRDFDVNKAQLLLQESSIKPGKKIRRLSAGEAQRLCMILAVSRKAGLYLMDEPASSVRTLDVADTAAAVQKIGFVSGRSGSFSGRWMPWELAPAPK